MRVIVAGSRSVDDYAMVKFTLDHSPFDIDTVISGGARGADRLGERWAKENRKTLEVYPANWEFGPPAGPMRNQEMADRAEALILFWDGKSPGSRDMLNRAGAKGLAVFIVRTDADQ